MKGFFYMISVLFLTAGLMSCGRKETPKEEIPLVGVAEAKAVGDGNAMTFTGRTKAASEVNLAFRVSGPIQRVLVKEGDHVSKGQVVAEMDSRDYQVQLAATQAEYAQVKADAERVMALYAEGNTTASNHDKARYGLQQITQKLANHKNQLADTKLKSTIDGYVQTKLHEAGEVVSAGMPVLTVFDNRDIEVEIHISASDFSQLDKFDKFYCRFDALGETNYPLAISRTNQEANADQLYTVRLKFAERIDQQKITPGMSAMVYADMTDSEDNGAVTIPSSAVLMEDGKTQVYIYQAETGTVKLRPVSVSAFHRDGTVQVDKGVKIGDKVVASGVHHVKDGQKVRLLQKPSSSNVGGLL